MEPAFGPTGFGWMAWTWQTALFWVFIATAAMEVPTSFQAKYRWLAKHFPFIPASHIVYCGDKSILLNGNLNPRLKPGDMVLLVKDSAFAAGTPDTFVYLYSKLGDRNGARANGGLRERADERAFRRTDRRAERACYETHARGAERDTDRVALHECDEMHARPLDTDTISIYRDLSSIHGEHSK